MLITLRRQVQATRRCKACLHGMGFWNCFVYSVLSIGAHCPQAANLAAKSSAIACFKVRGM